MKKSIFFLLSFLLAITSFANGIDEKFIRLFESSFPKAERVSWEQYNDSYVVSFTESGIEARALYAKDESYVRFTRYYTETTLPYHVKYIIGSKYANKKLIGVNEVSTILKNGDVELNYYLILEDKQNRLMIRMDSVGRTDVVEKFKKEQSVQ